MSGRRTRRRFLHGLGIAAALGTAGCSGLSLGAEDEPTIDADDLITLTNVSVPSIPERLPVAIEDGYLEGIATDVRESLDAVPTPLTATHVPNGAIREDLTHLREHVDDHLDAAADAASPYEALEEYRRAAATATELATAWAVVDDGLPRAAVAERTSAIEHARTRFVRQWTYRGADPVDAAVVHATLELDVRTATRLLATDDVDRPDPPENALTIGEFAAELERARASIEDADYLYQRFLDSVTDAEDLHESLEAAAETLVADITRRADRLPDVDASDPSTFVDRDISGTPAGEVLQDLYRELDRGDYASGELAEGRPANAVLAAVWTLAKFRAFDSILEDVAEGTAYTVETADDVGSIRTDAVDSLAAATDVDAPILANRTLARLADDLRFADRRLTGNDGSVEVSFIRFEIAEYVQIAAIARAVPATITQVVDAVGTVS